MIATIMQRYVDGESWKALRHEKGIKGTNRISQWVKTGQLAGTYKAHFDCPAIGLDEYVEVPQIPEIISSQLFENVKQLLNHNRTYNRHDTKKYLLTGFIRCEHCKKSLSGQTESGIVRYRHKKEDDCTMRAVRGDMIEPAVLDYLYTSFLDEPNYNKAVERAMPSTEHRQKLIKELGRTEKKSAENSKEIANLVDAIAKGVDPTLLIGKQDQLKAEQNASQDRLEALGTELATMPSAEQTKAAASLTRLQLMQQHTGKDWRELAQDEIKQFLFHLFGKSKIDSDTGIFIRKDEGGRIVATFKGQVAFAHEIVDGRPMNKLTKKNADQYNSEIRRRFDMDLARRKAERQAELDDLKPCSTIVTACASCPPENSVSEDRQANCVGPVRLCVI